MKYSVVKNIEEFKLLENDWNRLYNQNLEYSVFQSFSFNFHSWKHMLSVKKYNKLFIVKIIKDEKIIAILPSYINHKNRLRFINDIHADFCDLLSSEEIDFNKLFDFLIVECKLKRIQFINLKSNSLILKYLEEKHIKNSNTNYSEVFSFLQVEKGNFPANCNNLLSKQKNRIRRIIKKNKGLKNEILSSEQYKFPTENIIKLRNKMIHSKKRKKSFLDKNHLQLLNKLWDDKLMIISVIKKENLVNALSFILKRGNSFMFWIDLFDENKMMNLNNYILFIKDRSLNNNIQINFGRGGYEYKISNFKPEIEDLYSVNVFNNSLNKIRFEISSFIMSFIKKSYHNIKK